MSIATRQLDFLEAPPQTPAHVGAKDFRQELEAFREFGSQTVVDAIGETPVYINEFWTAKQRAAHSLHEVSYRACFKPQLPRFFIERLTKCGDAVYDPFMGRGTTLIEAALLGRKPIGCDVNPLSAVLTNSRLNPPRQEDVLARLKEIDLSRAKEIWDELLVFYHPETLRDIAALKEYFLSRRLDAVDEWIRLVAINRLTGHSPGFFSVYTMPPNQAVSIKSQKKINERRKQTPTRRDVKKIIAKKSAQLLKDLGGDKLRAEALLLTRDSKNTPEIRPDSVQLVVTSPPFLDIVDYAGDNWLRCWFLGIDAKDVQITAPRKLETWAEAMTAVFRELHRVLKPGGWVAFEVGEVRKGKVRLEETVLRCGAAAGLHPELVMINAQEFTKTANCWGVDNNAGGTNTNRITLFRKAGSRD